MKKVSLYDLVAEYVEDYGSADIRTVLYYIKALSELEKDDSMMLLVGCLLDAKVSEQIKGNFLMSVVLQRLMIAIIKESDGDYSEVDNFTICADGCASSLDYDGDNDTIFNIVYSL